MFPGLSGSPSGLHGRILLTAGALFVTFAALLAFDADAAVAVTSPLLFVTQVPIPREVNDGTVSNVSVSVVSTLGNHLGDTANAGRGGDLWLRYTNGTLKNVTRAAGFGTSGAQHGVGIAVRDPFVHWGAGKALFSMVVGAPAGPNNTNQFFWQLYELTNLAALIADSNTVPAIIKVPLQPTNYNNVMPCYGTDGRIIFVTDRPRDGSPHLYPQLDEYNNVPSNTGIWRMDPATGALEHLDHSPSGSFNPFIDSFGRLLFVRWDHLVQDRNATDDRMGRATNGTFDYFSEASTAFDLSYRPIETFPEPRTYDSNQLAIYQVQGNAINLFLPWMANEDGTSMEILNHVGRHELLQSFRGSSFTNDPNLRQLFNLTAGSRYNTNYLNNFLGMREDPLHPGTYFGVDGPDFGMHSAGQILTLFGPPGTNGEQMYISYITPKTTSGPNSFGAYRNPVPLANGGLVASYTTAATLDGNSGTAAAPKSSYNFRLMSLVHSGATWTTNQYLTPGLTNIVSYYVGPTLVSQTGALWEIEAVEVAPRPAPPAHGTAAVSPIEAQVFAEEGVLLSDMQSWLKSNDLALVISRDVTRRDRADREQPFNLRVPGGVQTLATNNAGKIYDISYMQFLQADQLRGLTFGTTNPVPGRRVLAKPLHEPAAAAFNVPVTNGPVGATRLGLDGSQATLVPARRALTHQTVSSNGQAIVRERYWITYQPGEVRTCPVCHGLNVADQANRPAPTNAPAALRELLRSWKDQTRYAKILSTAVTNGALGLNVTTGPSRTNVLQASDDLVSWSGILTNPPITTNGLFWLFDTNGVNGSQKFYRIAVP